MELKIDQNTEVEFEFEIIDESYDHEFGTQRMVGVNIVRVKVYAVVLGEFLDVTPVLPGHMIEEIKEKCAAKIDPYVSTTMNGKYQGEH